MFKLAAFNNTGFLLEKLIPLFVTLMKIDLYVNNMVILAGLKINIFVYFSGTRFFLARTCKSNSDILSFKNNMKTLWTCIKFVKMCLV
jgi:hypothetical protein